MIALLTLATDIKNIQLHFSENSRWIEPLFYGLSLLMAVSLASRSQVIKIPKRKKPGTVTQDAPPADVPAPV